jgi:uncharacterized protein YjbI with pentapeptide repeats
MTDRRHSDFAGQDLTGARFVGDDLYASDFTDATLDGADFDAANLEGCLWTGASVMATRLPPPGVAASYATLDTRWARIGGVPTFPKAC